MRDLYFACVDKAAASGGTASKQCKAQRSAFEKDCPKSWVRVSRADRVLLATSRAGDAADHRSRPSVSLSQRSALLRDAGGSEKPHHFGWRDARRWRTLSGGATNGFGCSARWPSPRPRTERLQANSLLPR